MAKKLTKSKAKEILHDKSVHGHPLTDKQRRFFGAIAGGAKPYKAQIGTMLTGFHPNLAETLSEMLSAPQKAVTQLVTGKYQTPSEAMGIENAAGAFLTDVVLDPLGLMGLGAGTKAAKASTKTGILSKAYLKNPIARKELRDPNKSFRVAGMDAYDDFVESGVVRSVTPMPQPGMSFVEKMKQRPTAFPSFQKGYADMRYLPKEGGVVFETSLPTFKRGDINPVTGNPVKGRHYAHRVIDTETGKVLSNVPGKDIKAYKGKPHWLMGYQEIKPPKKKQDGGWLDKYEQGGLVLKQKTHDNYGKKPNANYPEVTLPPGFVGQGYNIKGRNYSPAWGGQFQNGGNLMPPMAGANQTVPMAQTGTRQPIYTSDLQDPRLRNYQDSLSAYIENEKRFRGFKPYTKEMAKQRGMNWNPNYVYILEPNDKLGVNEFVTYKPKVKKPVQPVEYRKRILEKPSLSVDLPNIELTDVRPAIAQSAFEQARVDMSKPTKYSFTYPTFDQDVQKTMYFPDRNSWKTFVEQQRGASSQEGKDYGSATGQFAMGGSLPGAVGFTYARVSGAAPANGPYAKKTKASAQNGQEMSFYQHGLDWKPKNISRNGNWLDKFEEGGEIIKDNEGYWNPENWGKPVEIGSNEITMEGVLEPLLGVSDTGDTQMMYPGKNYTFSGTKVVEYPREYFQELGVAKDGKSVNRADEYPLEKLDNLLNFTNYNKPQKAKSGKWLDKYQ